MPKLLTRQRGFAVAFTVILTGIAVIAIIGGATLLHNRQLANRFVEDREAYMDDIRQRLEGWYERNMGIEAEPSGAYTSEELLSAIGVVQRYSVHLAMSPQLNDGTVRYRKVAIVVPDVQKGDASGNGYGTYSSDGIFTATPGFVAKEFDGRAIQQRALAVTTKNLQTLATMLEQRVAAKMQTDMLRDGTTNYFLPRRGCDNPRDDEFPCTDGWVSVSSYLANQVLLGSVDGIAVKNAWGGEVMINNDISVNSAVQPFTIALESTTPWGTPIEVKAVQPIY